MSEWDGKSERRKMNVELEQAIIKLSKREESSPKILGMKISELVTAGSILLAVGAFYVRTDDTLTRLVKITDYLGIFAKNSDNYHSSINGVQFEQGKPVNPAFSGPKHG